MKSVFAMLIMFFVVAANAQTDTVMMNKRFSFDENQRYELSSLKLSASCSAFSISLTATSVGLFTLSSYLYRVANSAQSDAWEKQNREGGDVCMAFGIITGAAAITLNIASIVQMRKPTTIKPVYSL